MIKLASQTSWSTGADTSGTAPIDPRALHAGSYFEQKGRCLLDWPWRRVGCAANISVRCGPWRVGAITRITRSCRRPVGGGWRWGQCEKCASARWGWWRGRFFYFNMKAHTATTSSHTTDITSYTWSFARPATATTSHVSPVTVWPPHGHTIHAWRWCFLHRFSGQQIWLVYCW